ncbi:MAG: HlyD family efflux transporter periplasmic adaptor subunit [Deltaproteobacteria bacterium]|nr:HlyD family efflux transporter periplasmic adaptor subunit [Deltaproteobacteria bacterium]
MANRFCKAILPIFGVLVALGFVSSCSPPASDKIQGYVEGEFVYIASPLAGALKTLQVQRGTQVKEGDPLFSLENTPEKAARDEAQRRMAQARANLDDARKGKRPSEIASIEAQMKQARVALTLSEREFARQEKLTRIQGANSEQDLDRARAARDQDSQRVAQLEADLKTAQLGSRVDQLLAAEATQRAQEAVLARADWDLSQKAQSAPRDGLVFDTLYREGEWVAAGRPVISLLPPGNIKVRAFIPETRLAAIHPGDPVRVTVDGLKEQLAGKVSFISPQAEFTPPVIYSLENRSKLVFMVEAVFDPETAVKLHPGQPVDVRFGS